MEWKKIENYILDVEVNHNVYFCVNLLSKHERKKENCLPTKLLWADLDAVELSKVEALPPSILIESSPGRYQALWRTSAYLPAYQAEDYSHRIAHALGADASGWDLTQLLRVPFTHNFKYEGAPEVMLNRALTEETQADLFERLPQVEGGQIVYLTPMPVEDLPEFDEVIEKYRPFFKASGFIETFSWEPGEGEDWSKHLWKLIHASFDIGMEKEEVFVIAQQAPSNKYARDNRPPEHLWRDVVKAELQQKNINFTDPDWTPLAMPELVGEPATGTVLDPYREWGIQATDAPAQFHDLSCMILLSAIVSNSVRLETSYAMMVPNLWGLILGESTVARKTTAMRMATDFLIKLEPELVLATDGSAEGVLTGLSTRPNRASVFYRDEVSGFFESLNKKDYLAGMPEVLTNLYDVPSVYTRRLRKETIHIESPAFIFFGGGVQERVYSAVTEEYIASGFMPRFLIVSGETPDDVYKPTGPPTEQGIEQKEKLLNFFMDLKEQYGVDVQMVIAGQSVNMPPRIMARPTEQAWELNGQYERTLIKLARESPKASLAMPTFERLSRSLLKVAMIFATTRQEPITTEESTSIEITEIDIKNAAWYIQDWGRYSVELIMNAGKKASEKQLDKIVRVVAENPGILRSTLMQHYHLSKREADDILGTLEDRMLIRKEKQGRGWRYYTT
jgi:hypothetical protein